MKAKQEPRLGWYKTGKTSYEAWLGQGRVSIVRFGTDACHFWKADSVLGVENIGERASEDPVMAQLDAERLMEVILANMNTALSGLKPKEDPAGAPA